MFQWCNGFVFSIMLVWEPGNSSHGSERFSFFWDSNGSNVCGPRSWRASRPCDELPPFGEYSVAFR